MCVFVLNSLQYCKLQCTEDTGASQCLTPQKRRGIYQEKKWQRSLKGYFQVTHRSLTGLSVGARRGALKTAGELAVDAKTTGWGSLSKCGVKVQAAAARLLLCRCAGGIWAVTRPENISEQ